MYKTSVPVRMSPYYNQDDVLAELSRVKADRLFLVSRERFDTLFAKDEDLDELKEMRLFFEGHGFETGVWIGETIGHGSPGRVSDTYTRIVNLDGKAAPGAFCPLDEQFAGDICDLVTRVARTGTKMIMLDDDFRMAFRGGLGCCCDRHLADYRRRLDETVCREEIMAKAFCGKPNKYRDAWLDMTGETLKSFARQIRAAIDRVDPGIRAGLCASPSTWDTDGVDSITLTRILAGKTRPFLRLIGAPYWAVNKNWGNNLASVIELSRLECHWAENEDMELFSEGDVFPRPRHTTPASYLEGFDTAMRAAGTTQGILKYMLDYTARISYEKGYLDRMAGNLDLYAGIDRLFGNKKAAGVNVLEVMQKLRQMDLPETPAGANAVENLVFPMSQRFLADNAIPMAYGDDQMPTIIFGENAKYADRAILKNGAILDAEAAQIFVGRGIDVGLLSMQEGQAIQEHYLDEDESVTLYSGVRFYHLLLNESARLLTTLIGADREIPGAYTYENAQGERFLVFPFKAMARDATGAAFRTYARQRLLAGSIAWLCGQPLAAVCAGHPDLYMLCKKGPSGLAVGLWNFHADPVEKLVVVLSQTYGSLTCLNCTGKLSGSQVVLSEMAPFSFAGFEVTA